jgi:hypothetical protein
MPEICSCGAQLPPDALFCHKCGKPQREIVAVEAEAPVAAPPPVIEAPVAQPVVVNFRNMEALKVALLAAMLSMFLFFLPIVNWLAAGYFAVFFYRRRTRQTINILAGVRIGWLTGLITFAIVAFFTLLGALALRTPEVMEMFKAAAQKSDQVQQMLGIMQDGPRMAGLLSMYFLLITFVSMTGGLLGAMLTGKVSPPPRGGNIA